MVHVDDEISEEEKVEKYQRGVFSVVPLTRCKMNKRDFGAHRT